MKKPDKRLVEKAKVLDKYLNNPIKPVTHVSIKPVTHVSIKPGHAQVRNCSAEYWFK